MVTLLRFRCLDIGLAIPSSCVTLTALYRPLIMNFIVKI